MSQGTVVGQAPDHDSLYVSRQVRQSSGQLGDRYEGRRGPILCAAQVHSQSFSIKPKFRQHSPRTGSDRIQHQGRADLTQECTADARCGTDSQKERQVGFVEQLRTGNRLTGTQCLGIGGHPQGSEGAIASPKGCALSIQMASTPGSPCGRFGFQQCASCVGVPDCCGGIALIHETACGFGLDQAN